MNPCKYTGADVYLPDYDITIPADVFEIGGCAMLRVQTEGQPRGEEFAKIATFGKSPHTTHIATPGIGSWVRFDLGIVAMPSDQLEGPRR
jgi:hypothetical protein